MKRLVSLVALVTVGYAGSAHAVLGLGLGAEVGSASYSGDVFPASGDIGTGTRYGIVLELGALPVVNLQIRARYFARDFRYTYSAAGVPVTTAFTYQDASALALLKADVFAPPLSPVALYVGAGVGLHVMNTDIASQVISGNISVTPSSNPFSLLDKVSRTSGLGLIGLRLSAPVIPLAIFGEVSYEAIFGASRLNITGVSGGMMLTF